MSPEMKPLVDGFVDVVRYAHETFGAPIDKARCARQVADMYVQFIVGMTAANHIKDMGPGIRLDFAGFTLPKGGT